MKFISYASGSTGNLYSVSDGKTHILLECGLPYGEMQKLTGHILTTFDACLLTHEHGDHAKGGEYLYMIGTPIYTSKGTAEAIKLPTHEHGKNVIQSGITFWINTMRIMPFSVEHDAADPLGFLIHSTIDDDMFVFATDTFYLKHRFPAVTIFAIECNYAHDLIGDCPYQDRLFQSHMSLQQCIDTLKANDLSRCREIHLLHLSDSHSDEARFVREVQSEFCIPTYAAPKRIKP